MTQARGIQGQLLMLEDPESAYGTDPSSVHSVILPFNDFGVQASRNLITPVTITGRRDPASPAQGRIDVGGAVVVPVDQCAIGYWLGALMGTPTSTATGSAYQHIFQCNSNLGSHVFEQGFLDAGLYQKFTGCKIGGMTIRVGGDEELTASFDIMGKTDTPAASTMSSRATTLVLNRFNQFDAGLQEGGAAIATVREMEFTLSNNLDGNVYTIASGDSATRGGINAGMAEVSGRMSCMFESWSYYLYAVSGTERSLELNFRIGSFHLDFKISKLVYERQGPVINTPEGVWLDLPFKAYYDVASGSVLQATLVNTWAVYSGHM